jgi:Kef-type K+ transport system membrane component KefB
MRSPSRSILLYALSLLAFAGAIAWVLAYADAIEARAGRSGVPAQENPGSGTPGSLAQTPPLSAWPTPPADQPMPPAPEPGALAPAIGLLANIRSALRHPFPLLLAQLSVVVGLAGACGLLARRLGQPAVIGEMAAGIALGPSLLGHLFPGLSLALFPAASLGPLNLLSQVGVLLFLFAMGMEIDLGSLRRHARQALFVSHSGIVAPFLLGLGAALFLYTEFAPRLIHFPAFALFLGIAMSITAFPVLARILSERNLLGTPLGQTAMASAAVDDVTAWILLALVIAVAKAASPLTAVAVAAAAAAFTFAMLFLARPAARRLPVLDREGRPKRGAVLAALIALFLASLGTEAIGIHALFGAFLAGVAMPPQPAFRTFLRERLEYPASLFLLPVFFASTGLRTRVDGLSGAADWGVFALLLSLAVAGKLGGVSLAARATGSAWRDAFALGALMNTRGLMELIVLNVGLDLGILSPRLFTLMVLVALATTAMTGPLLGRILGTGGRKPERAVSPGSTAGVRRGS